METNLTILSVDFFSHFLERPTLIQSQINIIILEFEYLYSQKMPSEKAFIDMSRVFLVAYSRICP